MSLAIIKSNLKQLIEDESNRVVALSGSWGSGKSHLWREVQKESDNSQIKAALYVSLFGVKDIAQLKLKIIQSNLPDSETGNISRELMKTGWKEASRLLRSVHPSFSALDEIALLAIPGILRKRFIVIDDIERKHKDLGVDEVMGFIDEFTQNYSARFLLISNSTQLDDKRSWEILREKVIDHEIQLALDPMQAFEIATKTVPSPHAKQISDALAICGVSNIRIIHKIIRLINKILLNRTDITPEILARIIPSTTVLSAVYYKGIENGPSSSYILGFQSSEYDLQHYFEDQTPSSEDPVAKANEKRWNAMLKKLNVVACDDYEKFVVSYLETGLLDRSALAPILDRYVGENNQLHAQTLSTKFAQTLNWRPEVLEPQLVALANEILPMAHFLTPVAVSEMHRALSEMTGGDVVAKDLIGAWVNHFRSQNVDTFDLEENTRGVLHPDIQQVFMETVERLNPTPSLFDAVMKISRGDRYGEPDLRVLREAGVTDHVELIRTMSGTPLRNFMIRNMDSYNRRGTLQEDIRVSTDRFIEACRDIYCDDLNTRIAKIILRVFSEANAQDLLTANSSD